MRALAARFHILSFNSVGSLLKTVNSVRGLGLVGFWTEIVGDMVVVVICFVGKVDSKENELG